MAGALVAMKSLRINTTVDRHRPVSTGSLDSPRSQLDSPRSQLDSPRSCDYACGLDSPRRKERLQRNRTVILIDWDDTILPSYEMMQRGIGEAMDDPSQIAPEFWKKLQGVEVCALKMLRRAVQHGRVVVVTASESGWVEKSAALCMPKVLAFFKKHSIKVISARSRYQKECGPLEWKMRTFHDEVKRMFTNKDGVHAVVIGDGMLECIAAQSLRDTYRGMVVKTVKLAEMPSADALAVQLAYIESMFGHVFEGKHSFQLNLA